MTGDWNYCESCGSIFTHDEIRIVTHRTVHYWLDDKPTDFEYEWLCPECGSACIEEAEYCEICGEPLRPSDLVDGLCEICREEVAKDEGASEQGRSQGDDP